MAFVYKGQLNGAENPVIRTFLIKDSAHVAVGEALTFSTGADTASAGNKILGICVGIVDSDGIGLDNTAQTLGGTWVSSTKTYTADSDNVSTEGVRVQVICDKDALFRCDANASISAIEEGMKFNVANGTAMDGSAGVDAAGQFELVKYDPENQGDASMGLYKICESYGDAYVQQ